MSEAVKTPDQEDYGWYKTLSASGKYPLIANRIWNTLTDVSEYIKPTFTFACAGLIMKVINDGENNGAYIVENDDSESAFPSKLKLTRLASQSSSLEWEEPE